MAHVDGSVGTEPEVEGGGSVDRESLLHRLRNPLMAAGAVLAGSALLLAVDPNQPGHYPVCPSKWLLGLDCPFCGGMRCTRALLTGDVSTAWDQNALVVLLAPVAVVGWLVWMWSAWRGRAFPRPPWSPPVTRVLMWCAVAILLIWTIVRNIPWGSYWASGLG